MKFLVSPSVRNPPLTQHPSRGSFAYMEISSILAKLHFRYDMDLVDEGLDWEGESHMHVMWWKPELRVRMSKVRSL